MREDVVRALALNPGADRSMRQYHKREMTGWLEELSALLPAQETVAVLAFGGTVSPRGESSFGLVVATDRRLLYWSPACRNPKQDGGLANMPIRQISDFA